MQLGQVGNLLAARRTPGRPVIDHDPIPAIIGQRVITTIQSRQSERHFGLARARENQASQRNAKQQQSFHS